MWLYDLEKELMKPKLKYIGNGRFVVGVPARDLTQQDLIALAANGWSLNKILALGGNNPLYKLVKSAKKKEDRMPTIDEKSHGGVVIKEV